MAEPEPEPGPEPGPGPEPQGKVPWCTKFLNYFLCHSNDPEAPKKTVGRKCIDCLKPDKAETGNGQERETWANRCQFFISTLGMSVGLGSVWRFPTLTYKMGGASFVLIYTIVVMLIGNTLFFFEVTNGQYTSKNPLRVYDKVPLFQGIGFAMIAYSYLFCTYYIHMVSYSFFYLFSCFRNPLPWTYCPDETKEHEDSVSCKPFPGNMEKGKSGIFCGNDSYIFDLERFCKDKNYQKEQMDRCCASIGNVSPQDCSKHIDPAKICGETQYPSEYHWSHSVVQSYREGDPKHGYLGPIHGVLIGTLFLSWLICYIGLYKGLRSMGVMMYIVVPLPYIILIIMFVAAIIQDGAVNGIRHLFIPKLESLYDINVWRIATEQAFYSIGVAMGPLVTFGSYQKFNSPSHIDGTLICLSILLTGVLCALVVFSVLGFLAAKTGREFSKVVEAGPGLVFIVYPESLQLLPGSAFFAFLFYLMLINLGISSVTGIIETVSSAVYDIWPKTRRYKYIVSLVVILSSFLIGLSITARGGVAVYNAFDTYAAGMTLIPICTIELFVIVVIYGLGRFCEDIAFMLGFYPNRYYRYFWMIGPFILSAIFIYGLYEFKAPQGWRLWTHILSWTLFFIIMGCIPIMMIYQLIYFKKNHNLKNVIKPPPDHGPANPEQRQAREDFAVKRKIF